MASKNIKNTYRLFSYGTLNLHNVQKYLWGEEMQGTVGELIDYELNVYDNGIYYIDKRFGETVAGKVYTLNKEQLDATDRYEGKAYKRELVSVDGETVHAYVRVK